MSASTNALCTFLTALRRASLFSIAIFALFIYLTPIARAQSALDGFAPGLTPGKLVNTVAIQPDGKIIIGGFFDTVIEQNTGTSTPHNNIARFNPDGTLDPNFDLSADATVEKIVVQPDGKVLVGGSFTTIGGVPCSRLARLNADGTIDGTFTNPGLSSVVYAIAVQTDGSIVAGGLSPIPTARRATASPASTLPARSTRLSTRT